MDAPPALLRLDAAAGNGYVTAMQRHCFVSTWQQICPRVGRQHSAVAAATLVAGGGTVLTHPPISDLCNRQPRPCRADGCPTIDRSVVVTCLTGSPLRARYAPVTCPLQELLLGLALSGIYSNEAACSAVARAVCMHDAAVAEKLVLSLVAIDVSGGPTDDPIDGPSGDL